MSNDENMNKPVFFISGFFILLITVIASIFPSELESFFKGVQTWIVGNGGWIYVLSVAVILFASVWLMLSRFGNIKLGLDHSTPEYSNLSWFAMLFSAGMGIGLMFWGVAEPVMHFSSPPTGSGLTVQSAQEAMKITFFHWGLHAWAIYAILAVILAYFCYRKDLPLLPRSAFYPFIGDRIHGPIGNTVDIFAIIGTMFGVATSLGLGVTQVNAGLHYLFDVPQTPTMQVVLIAIITSFATISVVLGLDGGIKKLSNINIALAGILMLLVLVLGDTVGILQAFVQNTGAYFSDIIYKTFNLYTYSKKETWIGGWTLLYWAWWISWSPFVGMFIARISKGRTIKEFLVGVLFIPTGFTFLWMTVFGNSAIDIILSEGGKALSDSVNDNVAVAIFKFFEFFPMTSILSLVALMLVTTFFVSSSDSGSLVIDTLASGGAQEPPVWQRIFWAVTEGVVAATLLLAGGLDALQTMTILSAFPIILLILFGFVGLVKSLRADWLLTQSVQHYSTSFHYHKAESSWKDRLDTIVSHPPFEGVEDFLANICRPALSEVCKEMKERGLRAEILERGDKTVALLVKKDDADDFLYEVKLRAFESPVYMSKQNGELFRAEVFLMSGGQEYNVYGYNKEQIAADVIHQYEKHFQFLHLNHAAFLKS